MGTKTYTRPPFWTHCKRNWSTSEYVSWLSCFREYYRLCLYILRLKMHVCLLLIIQPIHECICDHWRIFWEVYIVVGGCNVSEQLQFPTHRNTSYTMIDNLAEKTKGRVYYNTTYDAPQQVFLDALSAQPRKPLRLTRIKVRRQYTGKTFMIRNLECYHELGRNRRVSLWNMLYVDVSLSPT